MIHYAPLDIHNMPHICAMEREAYPEPWSSVHLHGELLNTESVFLVMYEDKEIIGYGGYWRVVDEAHITRLTIRADRRREGLGIVLLRHLLDQAQKQNIHRALLEVRRSNTVAHTLYLREGFKQIGLRKGYYASNSEDALIMIKELYTLSDESHSAYGNTPDE